MALNGLFCADVRAVKKLLTHSLDLTMLLPRSRTRNFSWFRSRFRPHISRLGL